MDAFTPVMMVDMVSTVVMPEKQLIDSKQRSENVLESESAYSYFHSGKHTIDGWVSRVTQF